MFLINRIDILREERKPNYIKYSTKTREGKKRVEDKKMKQNSSAVVRYGRYPDISIVTVDMYFMHVVYKKPLEM